MLKRYVIKLILGMVIFLGGFSVITTTVDAISTTVSLTNMTGYYQNSTYYYWIAYPGFVPTINANVTVSLPTNIKVTSASLNMYGYAYTWYNDSTWGMQWQSATLYGTTLYGCPSWGSAIGGGGSPYVYWNWQSFNVSDRFTTYAGGTQAFSISSSIVPSANAAEWRPVQIISYKEGSAYPPYLTITYSYIPSIPAISSPVAGSYHPESVNLSASSSVTGGSAITYTWQYQKADLTWENITTTSSNNYTWAIPTSIIEDSTVFVKCKATSLGVDTAYSAPVSFTKGYEPAVAAKMAAQAAEVAATAALAAVNSDRIAPVIDVETVSGARATSGTSINVLINAIDNVSTTFTYSINGETYQTLPADGIANVSLTLPGINSIVVRVKDLAGNIAQEVIRIWKI